MCKPKNTAGGFTLMELLVVLTVVGLLMSVVGPNLARVVGGVERASRRGSLLTDISGLSYRAFSLGQSFVLSNEQLKRVLVDGNPVLAVPEGWSVDVEEPVTYELNGWCSGGQLSVRSPDNAVEKLVLSAPDCRVNE